MGCFYNDGWQPLISFDSQKAIGDGPLVVEGVTIFLPDHQLELTPGEGCSCRDIDDVLQRITDEFKGKFPRDGTDDELWHLRLEKCIGALFDRRRARVFEWLDQNTADFSVVCPREGTSICSFLQRKPQEQCEHGGNCGVKTNVSKKTKTFKGKRAIFEYELVSEQNGEQKGCCLSIPPLQERHGGPHLHSEDPDCVHFCETRCPSCGYFCDRLFGHSGLHRTTHGNMREKKFVAESEDIDILDRKYKWGESGIAEMCNMYCKAQGRGHVHLIPCPKGVDAKLACGGVFDGCRHETCLYGPDFDVPKDEITHTAYWKYQRFEDPCSAEDRKEFDLCNHQCVSEEHVPPTSSNTSAATAANHASFCTESLWHNPVARGDKRFATGYVTKDGHHFNCDHTKNVSSNVIFIIDRSGSMVQQDIRPSMVNFSSNRLGCVYEAITRFIRTRSATMQEDVVSVILFHTSAQTVVQLEALRESIVDKLRKHGATGATIYSSGLLEAEKILKLSVQDVSLAPKSPTIIFLSDGGNNGGKDPLYHIRQMKALDPRLKVHTIMFGKDPYQQIMKDMASAGDGTFECSLDEVQLSRRFEGLAKSLKMQVASLM
ncbi:hypothetical protein R1sor_012306 [Riccia sorocarpa]|uniref:VWFA domain-containing protein n=1 Tax=Riccia sorocarpa TaxID=122646 RepID=A0ABD3I701_9MARC